MAIKKMVKKAAPKKVASKKSMSADGSDRRLTSIKTGKNIPETYKEYKAREKLAEYQRGTHPGRSALGMGSKKQKGFAAGFDSAKKAMQNNAPSSNQYVDMMGRKSNIVGYYAGMPIDAKKKKKKK